MPQHVGGIAIPFAILLSASLLSPHFIRGDEPLKPFSAAHYLSGYILAESQPLHGG